MKEGGSEGEIMKKKPEKRILAQKLETQISILDRSFT